MILGQKEMYDFCQKAFMETGNFGLQINEFKIFSKNEKIENHFHPNFIIYKQCNGGLDDQYDIVAKINFYNKAFYYGYYITFLKSNISYDQDEILFYLHKCINGFFLYRKNYTYEMFNI